MEPITFKERGQLLMAIGNQMLYCDIFTRHERWEGSHKSDMQLYLRDMFDMPENRSAELLMHIEHAIEFV